MDNDPSSNQQSEASDTETKSQTPSNEEALARFAARIKEERERWQAIIDEADENNPMFVIARRNLNVLDVDTPQKRLDRFNMERADAEQRKAREEQYANRALVDRKFRIWDAYIQARGKRYSKCRLDTFEATQQNQVAAMDSVLRYKADLKNNLADGRNLILYGPSGTGKDHLITGMVHEAIRTIEKPDGCERVEWTDGPALFASVRAEIGSDSDRDIVKELSKCWLLVLSDLVPPAAKLTDFQSDTVYRLIDYRYSRMLPTFASINVRNRQELDAGLGAAVADRLIDNAAAISCNWPSYRKPEPKKS